MTPLQLPPTMHLVCPIAPPFYKINGLLPTVESRKQVPAEHKLIEHHL
jgi:hypothetical protein